VLVQSNVISFSLAGTAIANSTGVEVQGSNNTICTDDISGNTGDGVLLGGSSNLVQSCFVGTDRSGMTALANSTAMEVKGNSNTIQCDVISGNSGDGVLISGSSNQVLGSYVGTTYTGIEILGSNIIGGSSTAARNVIAGNSHDGVLLGGSNNLVVNDYIGLSLPGKAVANGQSGILVQGNNNTLSADVISGNKGDGVLLKGNSNQLPGSYVSTTRDGRGKMKGFT
jgi:hypothetical protein